MKSFLLGTLPLVPVVGDSLLGAGETQEDGQPPSGVPRSHALDLALTYRLSAPAGGGGPPYPESSGSMSV